MKPILVCLIITLSALQYKLFFGDGGIRHWRQLSHTVQAQQETNHQLKSRNTILEADIQALKSGDQALEEQARYELGMIKENEVYYHFVEK